MFLVFLFTFSNNNKVNAGPTFRDCLVNWNTAWGSSVYDLLTGFTFANHQASLTGPAFYVCCDQSPCYPSPNLSSLCPIDSYKAFACSQTNQNIFCESVPPTIGPFSCGGIVGNGLITTNYTAYASSCPSLDVVANSLIGVVPNHGNALSSCQGKSNCPSAGSLSCWWDSGGWTCINTCLLQWTAPCQSCVTQSIPAPSATSSSVTVSEGSVSSTVNGGNQQSSNIYPNQIPYDCPSTSLALQVVIPIISAIVGAAMTKILEKCCPS